MSARPVPDDTPARVLGGFLVRCLRCFATRIRLHIDVDQRRLRVECLRCGRVNTVPFGATDP